MIELQSTWTHYPRYLSPMPSNAVNTTLYHLIDAGHLARHAMLVPLQAHGLEAGDDAMLFGLSKPKGATENTLRQLTGLGIVALDARLERLDRLGILDRLAIGSKLLPGARLTDKGREIADLLADNWRQLDEALIGELDEKNRKQLRKILKRFVRLLSL